MRLCVYVNYLISCISRLIISAHVKFDVSENARFLQHLKSLKEGEGSLLDNTMIVYGSGIGDGNRHNHNDLSLILAGGGCGTLKPGRHTRAKDAPHDQPLSSHVRTHGSKC